jgi:hypothetical protein
VQDFDRLDYFAWCVFEDFARVILPHLDFRGLAELAGYIRPGSGGPWQTARAAVAPKRDLLLADIAARSERSLICC